MRLQKKFFEEKTSLVARQLIGKKLVKYTEFLGKYFKVSGLIIETEAYGYEDDPASHAYGKITNRNSAMFGPVGHAYIYYIYGNHYCFNVVAKERDVPAGAVLIRSLLPIDGVSIMKVLRKKNDIFDLTSGPGKITQALRISQKYNKLNLTDHINNRYFYIEDISCNDLGSFRIGSTSRIGISKGLEKKWRFIMLNSYIGHENYLLNKFLSSKSLI